MHVYMCIYTYLHVYICVYVCICIYIYHTYIYIHVYVSIHLYVAVTVVAFVVANGSGSESGSGSGAGSCVGSSSCPLQLLYLLQFLQAPVEPCRLSRCRCACALTTAEFPWRSRPCPSLDPYNLADEPDEPLPVSLVSFKATWNLNWLHSGLALPARWWVKNHFHIPLLQEILGLIKDKKPKQGGHLLMPRNHKNLVPLQVRGKVLWFENNSRCVVLALKQGKEMEHLQWFMEEVNKDIENHAALSDPECPEDQPGPSHKTSRVKIPEDLEDLVNECLETLHEHPESLGAVYLTSRSSSRVHRKDKTLKDIRVKGLKRKQAKALGQQDQEPVKRQFDFAVQACIEFLDSRVPGAAASSNQQLEPAVPEGAPQAEGAAEGLAEVPGGAPQ